MNISQKCNYTGQDDYLDRMLSKISAIDFIKTQIYKFGSVFMLLVVTSLAFYFIKIKRRQCFGITILACMFLKHALIITSNFMLKDQMNNFKILKIVIISSPFAIGIFAHWSYASQYMKTCLLVPNLVKKA